MCISVHPAKLRGTTLYFGEATHPIYGLVHVLGYQNEVENYFSGPNAMILHFPSLIRMTPENVVDTTDFSNILDDMVNAVKPPEPVYRGISKRISSADCAPVYSFAHGIYHIVMSSDASRIPEALDSVPVEKRPEKNQELFDWYARKLPGCNLALCCFNNSEARRATPMLWFYKPIFEDTFFAPGIDCHTGGVPSLGIPVDVDHWCIIGSHRLQNPSEQVKSVRYSQKIPMNARSLLPDFVMGRQFTGQMANGDFLLNFASASIADGDISRMTRGLMPAVC